MPSKDSPPRSSTSTWLHVPEFRSVVLGQLGESRLLAAIDTDIAGEQSHARALDADASGVLEDVHRRVGSTILFESSGGQVSKVAHEPELRFALGEGLDVEVCFSTTDVEGAVSQNLKTELRQILVELGLSESVVVE
jgi:hypothetical protein